MSDPGTDERGADGPQIDGCPADEERRLREGALPIGTKQELHSRENQSVLLHVSFEANVQHRPGERDGHECRETGGRPHSGMRRRDDQHGDAYPDQ